MTLSVRIRCLCLVAFGGALFALPAAAQDRTTDAALTTETFEPPPPAIAEAVLAPRYLNLTLSNPSPDGKLFLRVRGDGPPPMAMLAKPFHRLAGLQIDRQGNRERQMGVRSGVAVEITDAATGQTREISIPDGLRVSRAEWSPDGRSVAFFGLTEDATHLYVADVANGRARQVTRTPVLATLNTSFAWTADSRSLVTVLLPANRGPEPMPPAVPTGPQVRITTPETNTIRTYPDLLEDPFERQLLEYFTTGQLAVIDVERRRARTVGAPAMIGEVDVSPDGMYAQVTTMHGPFSYIVPQRQFATTTEIWSLETGDVLATVAEQELREGAPADTSNGNGDQEKRNVTWRPDGSGLSFLQQAPRSRRDSARTEDAPTGPGNRRGAGRADRVMRWAPPFDSASVSVVYENSSRLNNVRYSEDAQILFLTEQQGQNAHDFAVFLSDPGTKHTIWRGERQGGFFGRGGGGPNLLTKTLANGMSAVRVSGDGMSVFMSGNDEPEDPMVEGPRPYINRVVIRSGDTTRVYEGDRDGVFERVLDVLDDDVTQLIVQRESPSDVPDSFYRNLASGELRQITNNTDYTPDLTRAQRRRYNITRPDGLELAVNVTLPAGWSGERLPGMLWFYPREYTDQDDYDETRERYNKNAFPNIGTRSMDILVRQGYAVIEPDAPIIGESGRMNDNYVNDLRNNLAAVIDFLDAEGIIDRKRLGIGGHSYGAFSTVNALVHTPFFKAGIAGDGNYNRTLTPFSFQTERRSLWQSRETYLDMSPIFQADHITGALLMYHGAGDQNVGTFPINSWRLFESLESLGKTASLYVYPYEDHGPVTRETLLDLWGRWTAWLDKYVKNAGSTANAVTDVSGSAN